MQRIQDLRAKFRQWLRKAYRSSVLQFAAVAVVAVILGLMAGAYLGLPPIQQEAPAPAQFINGEQLKAVIRDQVHLVLEESYPWVLEAPNMPVVVAPPEPAMPAPTEPRPQPEPVEVASVSFEHLIWPAKGEVSIPFGWYRHPVYNDWRFNSGIELAVTGDSVRTVLPGKVVSIASDNVDTELVIDHGGGWQSTYRSVEGITVTPGQEVGQNQTIGRAANGRIFFSLSYNGQPVNPLAFLR